MGHETTSEEPLAQYGQALALLPEEHVRVAALEVRGGGQILTMWSKNLG